MCGRYVSATGRPELLEQFAARADTEEPDVPDWNVAPTKPVTAIMTRRRDGGPQRLLRVLRWGLVPSWAKDLSIGSRLINARIETAAEKPAFRAAAGRRRCLLPADGYYEWQPVSSGEGKSRKQAWFVAGSDGRPLAMAGLWEVWHDATGAPVLSAAVITGDAVDELGHLHDRSPMLVAPDDWAAWLDPGADDAAAALTLARPPAHGQLIARPVSAAVGNVRANGPELIEPIDVPGFEPLLF